MASQEQSKKKKDILNLNYFKWIKKNTFFDSFSIGKCYSNLKYNKRLNCCLRTRDALSFKDILEGALMRGEWRTFSEVSSFSFYSHLHCISFTRVLIIDCCTLSQSVIPAYLTLVTTHRIDLPMREEMDTTALRSAAMLKEFEPRKMELPGEWASQWTGLR